MWTVETLNRVVDDEIAALKHLEDKLWELRLKARSGIARAIYVTAVGSRVVIIRVFVKKSQKTPQRELELARQRAKEVE